jgi:hypothetical protein
VLVEDGVAKEEEYHLYHLLLPPHDNDVFGKYFLSSSIKTNLSKELENVNKL